MESRSRYGGDGAGGAEGGIGGMLLIRRKKVCEEERAARDAEFAAPNAAEYARSGGADCAREPIPKKLLHTVRKTPTGMAPKFIEPQKARGYTEVSPRLHGSAAKRSI